MVRGEKTVGFLLAECGIANTLTSIPKLRVVFLRRQEIQQGEHFRIQGAREIDKALSHSLDLWFHIPQAAALA